MALFRRKNSVDTGVPEEITDYYQSENRERTWMAWLLALATLAATALVVIGLFFGGRWVYRKTRHNSSPVNPVATVQSTQKPAAPVTSSSNSNSSTSSSSSTGTVAAPTTPSTSSSSTTPSSSSSTAPAAISTPSTATSSGLPNTGPGNILPVFLGVSVLGYLLHRKFNAGR